MRIFPIIHIPTSSFLFLLLRVLFSALRSARQDAFSLRGHRGRRKRGRRKRSKKLHPILPPEAEGRDGANGGKTAGAGALTPGRRIPLPHAGKGKGLSILGIGKEPVLHVTEDAIEGADAEGGLIGLEVEGTAADGPGQPVGAVVGGTQAPGVAVLVAGHAHEVVEPEAFEGGLEGHLIGDEGFHGVDLVGDVSGDDGVIGRSGGVAALILAARGGGGIRVAIEETEGGETGGLGLGTGGAGGFLKHARADGHAVRVERVEVVAAAVTAAAAAKGVDAGGVVPAGVGEVEVVHAKGAGAGGAAHLVDVDVALVGGVLNIGEDLAVDYGVGQDGGDGLTGEAVAEDGEGVARIAGPVDGFGVAQVDLAEAVDGEEVRVAEAAFGDGHAVG